LYAAEDSSMEVDYSSSDKVLKTWDIICTHWHKFSHFYLMVLNICWR
jgi:hypothetical protein